MTEKQIRNKGQIVTLILLLSLILVTLVGYVIGKYVDDKALEGRVIFTASLAENVILQEHTAQQQADGSYQLTEPFVTGNDYVLIPGLDIPKDPHILIEGKTNIPAYLFVEVVDALGQATSSKDGKPKAIVGKTVKGNGVSFMENQVGWHGKAPNEEQCRQALAELDAAYVK